MKNKTEELKLYRKIENLVNPFIKKWCSDNYAHLVDNDDNDGQELRENIAKLVTKHTEQIKKEAVEDFVKWLLDKYRISIWQTDFIKEMPIEVDVLPTVCLKQYLEKGQNESN